MSHGIFGWDLPPGVSVSDIPGNRPEDAEWEKLEQEFWDNENNCTKEQWNLFEKAQLSDKLMDIVNNAIEYGMEVARKQDQHHREQNDLYEKEHIEEQLNRTKISKKTIQRVMDIINGKEGE